MTAIIWHNPRCSTSRKTLELVRAKGVEPDIRLYLQDPPSRDELAALGLPAASLIRWKDAPELDRSLSDAAILDLLAEQPKLIERPILVTPKGAAIGRPPEAVLPLLG